MTLRLITEAIAPPPAALAPGTILAHRWKIGAWLGGGGAGAVHRADDLTQPGRAVAVKVLRDAPGGGAPAPEAVARFRREADAALRLAHPNIVAVEDLGTTDDGRLFLVLELVVGRPLSHLIAAGPLAPPRAAALAGQVLAALAHAHAAGMVHRDLKPDNVLVAAGDHVKLLDFGLVKLVGEAGLTAQGAVVGTPAYMAPEQALGAPVDARTDLYAVGLLLFALLAGRGPFVAGDAMALMRQQIATPAPRLPPPVPPALAELVERALAKSPRDRFPDATTMAAALESIFAPGNAPAPTSGRSAP